MFYELEDSGKCSLLAHTNVLQFLIMDHTTFQKPCLPLSKAFNDIETLI